MHTSSSVQHVTITLIHICSYRFVHIYNNCYRLYKTNVVTRAIAVDAGSQSNPFSQNWSMCVSYSSRMQPDGFLDTEV